MALVDGGTAGLIAGGVTFAVCAAAGSSGRTGSMESFAFAGGGSEDSVAFAVESVAAVAAGAGIWFFSRAFAALAPVAEAEPGVVGMMEAILSFSTRTKPKSVLILNMLSS